MSEFVERRVRLQRLPLRKRRGHGVVGLGVREDGLERIAENPQARPSQSQRHDGAMLRFAGVLVLVADDDRIPAGERLSDDRMALQIAGDLLRHDLEARAVVLIGPGREVVRQAKRSAIEGRDLADERVERPDVHAPGHAAGALGEDATGTMSVREDKQPALAQGLRHLPRIGRALEGFPAPSRRLDDDQRLVRSQQRRDGSVRHGRGFRSPALPPRSGWR
ncbi:hypothetical protein LRS04_01945 [Phenylobacterium sp. J367]|nr:hypothetical protein [Phenylobacterium sp. J367]MCR5877275.1 hypothetical protein [Phenylobacterium sp. J367]